MRERGFACQGDSVSVVFRRAKSLLPAIIILQQDAQWVTDVLQNAGLRAERQERT